MNKHFNITLIILLGICLTLSFAYNIYQHCEGKKMFYALLDFMVVNEIPVKWQDKELKKIIYFSNRENVPDKLIMAINKSERGLGSHTYGAKKIDMVIMFTHPVEDWQLLQCIKIVSEEMNIFIKNSGKEFASRIEMLEYIKAHKKEFALQLAKRYCPINEAIWFKNVLTNWRNYER